jgi:hypothetical protein
VGTGCGTPEVSELPSAWATRPQAGINSGEWPSRLEVGHKASDLTLENLIGTKSQKWIVWESQNPQRVAVLMEEEEETHTNMCNYTGARPTWLIFFPHSLRCGIPTLETNGAGLHHNSHAVNRQSSQMWDLKFSQRRVWNSELSSGMYCRLSTDVSDVRAHPWCRQHVHLKRRSTIILRGSTSQKTILNRLKC